MLEEPDEDHTRISAADRHDAGIVEVGQLLHKNRLFEVAIKKGIRNIELANRSIGGNDNGEKETHMVILITGLKVSVKSTHAIV